jgi:hypothetical protein
MPLARGFVLNLIVGFLTSERIPSVGRLRLTQAHSYGKLDLYQLP